MRDVIARAGDLDEAQIASTMMSSATGVIAGRPSRVAISPSVTSPAAARLGSSGCWITSSSKLRA